jgi:molecular chaperone DnaK
MGKIIGIDLGTTKSCVAVMENGTVFVIPNAGNRTTPSVVSFLKDGRVNVGETAKKQAIGNPENTVMNVKRLMGRTWEEVTNNIADNSYQVVKGERQEACIKIQGETYKPQVLCALLLQKLKQTAEEYLGEEVSEAVITVPAYFNDAQRLATKEAGELAGLIVRRIISEPTSAALAYGLNMNVPQKIAVFDLGGGTFDISILEIDKGFFQVISTNGDTHLGGNDLDQVVMDWLAEEFKRWESVDLRKRPEAWQRLKEAAEKAKIELSFSQEVEINIPYIAELYDSAKHIKEKLTRAEFEKLASPVFEKCLKLCEQTLKDSGLKASDLDEVIMVGESSRIPKVLEMVETFFGKKPGQRVNLIEAVAIGAAIEGAVLNGHNNDVLLQDVTPLSLGVETQGGAVAILIKKNKIVPTSKSEIFTTSKINQPPVKIEIHVLQGERPMASQNKSLGKFAFDDIKPDSSGTCRIEVTFDLDVNGILQMTAKDVETGKKSQVRIETRIALSKSEMEELKKKMRDIAIKDRTVKEKLGKINEAEDLSFQCLKCLEDYDDQLSTHQKRKFALFLGKLRKAIERQEVDAMDLAMTEIRVACAMVGWGYK